MSLHVWDVGSPKPAFACGRQPQQQAGGTVAVIVNTRTGEGFDKLRAFGRDVCRACKRAVRAARGKR